MNTSWYKYTFIVVNQTNNHIVFFPLVDLFFGQKPFKELYHPEGDPKPTYEGDSVRRVGHGV